MLKHREIKTVEHKGVTVTLDINYDAGTVSLVYYKDRLNEWQTKEWIFSGRTIEYMDGWLNILDAIKFAVQEAKKDLMASAKEKTQLHEKEILDGMKLIAEDNKRGKRNHK